MPNETPAKVAVVKALTAVLASGTLTAESAKELRKTLSAWQRSTDGRLPEACQSVWKKLQPQLGAFIDGRQSADEPLAAARTLAELLAPAEKPQSNKRRTTKPAAEPAPEPTPEPTSAE